MAEMLAPCWGPVSRIKRYIMDDLPLVKIRAICGKLPLSSEAWWIMLLHEGSCLG